MAWLGSTIAPRLTSAQAPARNEPLEFPLMFTWFIWLLSMNRRYFRLKKLLEGKSNGPTVLRAYTGDAVNNAPMTNDSDSFFRARHEPVPQPSEARLENFLRLTWTAVFARRSPLVVGLSLSRVGFKPPPWALAKVAEIEGGELELQIFDGAPDVRREVETLSAKR